MNPKTGEMDAREAASFIQGYVAAKGLRTPKALYKHIRIAAQIFQGGAFNPLDVYAMQEAAKKLWVDAVSKANKERSSRG